MYKCFVCRNVTIAKVSIKINLNEKICVHLKRQPANSRTRFEMILFQSNSVVWISFLVCALFVHFYSQVLIPFFLYTFLEHSHLFFYSHLSYKSCWFFLSLGRRLAHSLRVRIWDKFKYYNQRIRTHIGAQWNTHTTHTICGEQEEQNINKETTEKNRREKKRYKFINATADTLLA